MAVTVALTLVLTTLLPAQVQATASCPREVEPLIEEMLPDLPSYANRVIQRSRRRGNADPSSYIILAGRSEFEPLPLGSARSATGTEENAAGEVHQVFLTTLEQTYTTDEVLELQGYHWLFLTPTESGWRLVLSYSSIGSSSDGGATTPPQDSSYGAIAQAVRDWLRDCQSRRSNSHIIRHLEKTRFSPRPDLGLRCISTRCLLSQPPG